MTLTYQEPLTVTIKFAVGGLGLATPAIEPLPVVVCTKADGTAAVCVLVEVWGGCLVREEDETVA